jgi:hypothetical protein
MDEYLQQAVTERPVSVFSFSRLLLCVQITLGHQFATVILKDLNFATFQKVCNSD